MNTTAETTRAATTRAADADAAADAAAQARHARFGTLPEPIPLSALVAEVPATAKAGADYDAERSWLHYSCLALDLGGF